MSKGKITMSQANARVPSALFRAIATFLYICDGLVMLSGWLAAVCLVSLTLLIVSGVLLAALSRLLPWLPSGVAVSWEYSAYLMGAGILFGAPITLRAGGHIRMQIFLIRFGRTGTQLIEIATAMFGLLVTGFLGVSMSQFAARALVSGEVSGSSFTPLWIPEAALAAGLLLLALEMFARVLRGLFGLPLEDANLKTEGLSE